MDKYTEAVTSIVCPRMTCQAAIGQKCDTSGVVHPERKIKAWANGVWDPEKAANGVYGDLGGCPLACLQSIAEITAQLKKLRS